MNEFWKSMNISIVSDRKEMKKGGKGRLTKKQMAELPGIASNIDNDELEAMFREAWDHIFGLDVHNGMQILSVLYNELIKRGYRIWVSQLPTLYSPKDIAKYKKENPE